MALQAAEVPIVIVVKAIAQDYPGKGILSRPAL